MRILFALFVSGALSFFVWSCIRVGNAVGNAPPALAACAKEKEQNLAGKDGDWE